MMSDEVRRNLALFPIGIVQKLTVLTARQIRYYEQHELIQPVRTEGNQRLFSFNDVERLLEVKKLIDQGLNIAGIKAMVGKTGEAIPSAADQAELGERIKREISEEELHSIMKQELMERAGRPSSPATLIQGELSRFFH